MSNKLISMLMVRTVILCLQKQFSQRRIARELKLSRNTVKQYCASLKAVTTACRICKPWMMLRFLLLFMHTANNKRQIPAEKILPFALPTSLRS